MGGRTWRLTLKIGGPRPTIIYVQTGREPPMPTIQQLIRKPRQPKIKRSQVNALARVPSKAWCMYAGLYNDSEESRTRLCGKLQKFA